MGSVSSLVVLAALSAGQTPAPAFQHDFRIGQTLAGFLKLFGTNVDEVVRQEGGGLRLVLPTDGRQTYGWGVAGKFSLSGDFEVTGAYELMTVDPPTRGSGVGVVVWIASDAART